MSKTRIVIDLDQLSSALSQYDTIISEFEQAIKDTESAINLLKNSAWKSGASTAYFLHYEDTWEKNMRKRIKIIKHLKECLEKANTEYTAVCEELDTLDGSLT